jgi:hypothetical protein
VAVGAVVPVGVGESTGVSVGGGDVGVVVLGCVAVGGSVAVGTVGSTGGVAVGGAGGVLLGGAASVGAGGGVGVPLGDGRLVGLAVATVGRGVGVKVGKGGEGRATMTAGVIVAAPGVCARRATSVAPSAITPGSSAANRVPPADGAP